MSRRGSFSIHGLLVGIALLTLLTGGARWFLLDGSTVSGKTHIAFWNGFTGPDGIVMLKIIEDFNRENPDVEVVMQRIPWATYYNKLTVAGSDGRGPHIFVSHADALARLRRAGFVSDVASVTQGEDAIDIRDFDPYVAEYLSMDGELMGIPLDIHPQGLFCNTDMLKAAGFVTADGKARAPQNRDEFLRLVKLATVEKNAKLPDKQWGFAFTYWGANHRSLMPQFGGKFLDDQGNAVLNSPENIQALTFLQEIAKQNMAPPPDNGLGWFGFRTKRVAMVWDGIFMLGDLIRLNDLNYIGAPIPQIGPRPGTVANSHVLCIKANLGEKEREASERFIKYLSDHSLEWAAAGQVPARISVRNTPEFKAMPVQAAFAEQVPHMIYPPRTPVIFEFMLELDVAVEKVVRGQMEPKAALDLANTNAQAVIDRDRKEHAEAKP